MKTYSFHYGDQMIDCRLDEKRIIGELHMAETPVIEDPEAAIKEALAIPLIPNRSKSFLKPVKRWLSSPMIRPVLPIPMFSCQLFWMN